MSNSSDIERYQADPRSGNKFAPWQHNFIKYECVLHNSSSTLIDYDCDGNFDHNRKNVLLDTVVPYTLKDAVLTRLVPGSYKKEIIYQGKIENKINMSYREFYAQDGVFYIRDAFTQKIEYELDEHGEALVGFKGLRIEVLSATNNDITYKIIKGFN